MIPCSAATSVQAWSLPVALTSPCGRLEYPCPARCSCWAGLLQHAWHTLRERPCLRGPKIETRDYNLRRVECWPYLRLLWLSDFMSFCGFVSSCCALGLCLRADSQDMREGIFVKQARRVKPDLVCMIRKGGRALSSKRWAMSDTGPWTWSAASSVLAIFAVLKCLLLVKLQPQKSRATLSTSKRHYRSALMAMTKASTGNFKLISNSYQYDLFLLHEPWKQCSLDAWDIENIHTSALAYPCRSSRSCSCSAGISLCLCAVEYKVYLTAPRWCPACHCFQLLLPWQAGETLSAAVANESHDRSLLQVNKTWVLTICLPSMEHYANCWSPHMQFSCPRVLLLTA